jgi:hypothetical protein
VEEGAVSTLEENSEAIVSTSNYISLRKLPYAGGRVALVSDEKSTNVVPIIFRRGNMVVAPW